MLRYFIGSDVTILYRIGCYDIVYDQKLQYYIGSDLTILNRIGSYDIK